MVVEHADLDGLGLRAGEIAEDERAARGGHEEQDESDAKHLHTGASFGRPLPRILIRDDVASRKKCSNVARPPG